MPETITDNVDVQNSAGKTTIRLDANAAGGTYGALFLGADGKPGIIVLRDTAARDSVSLCGLTGELNIYDENGKRSLAVRGKAIDPTYPAAGMWIGAAPSDSPSGSKAGYLEIRNNSGNPSMILNGTNNSMALRGEAGGNKIILDGAAGDIILANADCAEDFDITESAEIDPGTVMVIEQKGKLQQSSIAYDKRVVGVVSGALNYKPGLVLDKRQSTQLRKSISLMGKVYCKADAQYGSIDVGDLLTTSNTPGHAMKATDPMKAFGSVIGKALGPLAQEIGLIPILVTLQ